MDRISNRFLSTALVLGTVAVAAFGFSELTFAQPAAPAAAPAGPGAAAQRPMQYDTATWVGCHRVAKGPDGNSGEICAPSIRTGTPEIQERLAAEAAANLAAGRGPAGRGAAATPAPMVCNPALNAVAGGGRGPTQGGRGKIRVLVVVKGHPYERGLFDDFLDCLGADITWTRADHPGADLLMSPAGGKLFDAYLFYDLGGAGQVIPDGSGDRFYPDPSVQLKKDYEALLKQGKGMVFIHHASAAWPHVWPEYSEVVGGACDWFAPVTVRGILDPHHGFYQGTEQRITVVDKTSPITQGLGDGFDVRDEAYACAWFPEKVHPLLTTSFAPPDPLVNLNPKRQYSNLAAWYKAAENSPVFYTQIGHDNNPWRNPAYQLLISNAIKWAASPEALAWAKKNPAKIFK